MWSESYRLGVDSIDKQHMDLFGMVTHLLEIVAESDGSEYKTECEKAIQFLKTYAVRHFAEEEEYQRSINYSGYTEHCRMHKEFISSVLEYEDEMISSSYSMASVTSFIALLAAWLAYHVAGADQEIHNDEHPSKLIIESFYSTFCTALNRMVYIKKADVKHIDSREDFVGDIAVSIDLTGDVVCAVEFVFTEEFTFKFLKSFLFITTKPMDSIVRSVLMEISNIVSKDAIRDLERNGVYCSINTISLQPKPPASSTKDFLFYDTSIGKFAMGVRM